MKQLIKPLLLSLLLFNGMGAVYGGWHMIYRPDGSSLKLPIKYLSHSPFKDYLFPGILLFSVIGIYSLSLFSIVLRGTRKYAWLLIVQGIILCTWIIAQFLFRIPLSFLHALFLFFGLLFIYTGMLKLRTNIIL